MSHADRHGVHSRIINLDQIDAFAVFCPDTDKVYYVLRDEVPTGYVSMLSLRLADSLNGQTKHIRPAAAFIGPNRLFGARSSKDRATDF